MASALCHRTNSARRASCCRFYSAISASEALSLWAGKAGGGGYLECNAADAALFVVVGVDGEGQMAMDSISSCRVYRRGVGVEFNVCDEDGGESRFCVGVANLCQHRVWEVENVRRHCGFLEVNFFSDEKNSSSSFVECKTTN
jgi:hypothetical protein